MKLYLRKRLVSMWVIVLVMVALTACSGSKKSYDNAAEAPTEKGKSFEITHSQEREFKEESKEESEEESEEPNGEPSYLDNDSGLPSGEKFIVRIGLSVETENFDRSVKRIEELAKELKGYIESVQASYGTTYQRSRNRYVNYMLRIPKGTSMNAINVVKDEVGLVVNEQMTTENVTKRIRDMKRDIELLKAKEDRLIELSKKTEDIEALIRIESELAMIISEREYHQAALQNVEYDVQYDFLSIDLMEVRQAKAPEEDSFIGDMKTAFRDSIDGMIYFFQGLVLFLIRSWFAILVLCIIILAVILVIKKARKKSRKNSAYREPNPYVPRMESTPEAPREGEDITQK